jgi:hypothetical protein
MTDSSTGYKVISQTPTFCLLIQLLNIENVTMRLLLQLQLPSLVLFAICAWQHLVIVGEATAPPASVSCRAFHPGVPRVTLTEEERACYELNVYPSKLPNALHVRFKYLVNE